MLPTLVVDADWSASPEKCWLAQARRVYAPSASGDGPYYRAGPSELVGDTRALRRLGQAALFWMVGGQQVGKGAIRGRSEILGPAKASSFGLSPDRCPISFNPDG